MFHNNLQQSKHSTLSFLHAHFISQICVFAVFESVLSKWLEQFADESDSWMKDD